MWFKIKNFMEIALIILISVIKYWRLMQIKVKINIKISWIKWWLVLESMQSILSKHKKVFSQGKDWKLLIHQLLSIK